MISVSRDSESLGQSSLDAAAASAGLPRLFQGAALESGLHDVRVGNDDMSS